MSKLTPEQEAAIAEYISRMTDFSLGDSKKCPMCGELITGARLYAKIEPDTYSLYVLPCDHRLGLWGGVPEWMKADGLPIEIVPSEWGMVGDEDDE